MPKALKKVAPTENGTNGQRDPATGRWIAGNRGGPGAPFLAQVARFRRVLVEAITEEDVAEIARNLVTLAKEGNLAAIRIALPYIVGRPPEVVEADEDDAGKKGPIVLLLSHDQANGLDTDALSRRDVHVVAVDEQDLRL